MLQGLIGFKPKSYVFKPVLLWLQWDTKNKRLLPDKISCYIFMRKDISCGSLIILQVGSKDWTIIMERKNLECHCS